MDADRNFKPFRWDLSRREQLPQVPKRRGAFFTEFLCLEEPFRA